MSQWRSMGGKEDADRSADGRVQRRNDVLERCRGSGDVGGMEAYVGDWGACQIATRQLKPGWPDLSGLAA